MAVRRKPSIEGAVTSRPSARQGSMGQDDAVQEFLWNIVAINSYFEEISFVWAQMLGVNVHQWMILMAAKDLDRGGGI